MASFVVRRIVGAGVLVGLLACSDPTDPNGSINVTLIAGTQSDGTPWWTLFNNTSDVVMWWSQCGAEAQHRDGGRWPSGEPLTPPLCDVFEPRIIESDESLTVDYSHTQDWQTGEYRFRLDLLDADGRLPEGVRISNTFWFEGQAGVNSEATHRVVHQGDA